MEYLNNEQIKKYIDKILIDKSITKVELASRMDCKPQQLNNILNKRNLAFRDVHRICNALDLELHIDIRDRADKTE